MDIQGLMMKMVTEFFAWVTYLGKFHSSCLMPHESEGETL